MLCKQRLIQIGAHDGRKDVDNHSTKCVVENSDQLHAARPLLLPCSFYPTLTLGPLDTGSAEFEATTELPTSRK